MPSCHLLFVDTNTGLWEAGDHVDPWVESQPFYDSEMDLDTEWARLDHRFQVCLQQAWISFCRRGLPVGAVVAIDEAVISTGRNRVYDPTGDSDPLQGTPLAHAEMNALASLGLDTLSDRCSLWSTHSPCAMCSAAIGFLGLGSARYLAFDLSDEASVAAGPTVEKESRIWAVVANMMFLHNVAWVGGKGNQIVSRGTALEPEITSLALRALEDESLIRPANVDGGLPAGLAPVWARVVEADELRRARV